ncbi:MAG: hypothetical protein HPM95_14560 [Alphaproteobacteria bacterium]|nr:hypothetical protein [Alphaproteobacteria bacterium]
MRIGRIEEDDWSVRRAATSSGVSRRTTDRRYARDPIPVRRACRPLRLSASNAGAITRSDACVNGRTQWPDTMAAGRQAARHKQLGRRPPLNTCVATGKVPVLLTSPQTPPFVRSIVERFRAHTTVMSRNEVHARTRLKTVGTARPVAAASSRVFRGRPQ